MKTPRILIDTNALVLLLVGLIDPRQISKHKRTSIYSKRDFDYLVQVIGDFGNLVVLPNVWTELDNLLNRFPGSRKEKYILYLRMVVTEATEEYISTSKACESAFFYDLGVTDSLLIELGSGCDLLITADSKLSDYAFSRGLRVIDLVKKKNEELKG